MSRKKIAVGLHVCHLKSSHVGREEDFTDVFNKQNGIAFLCYHSSENPSPLCQRND